MTWTTSRLRGLDSSGLARDEIGQGKEMPVLRLGRAYETAAVIFKERIALTPNTDLSRAFLASALGHLGRRDEAAAVWRELKEINPRYSPASHSARIPFRNPADANKLLAGLREAGLPEE